MFERMDEDARQRLAAAAEEAKRRGDGRIGTEHLLLALLHDPGSLSARVIGADVEQARAALDALDRAALAAVGVEVGAGGPPAAVPTRRRPPFSSGSRAVIVRALAEAQAAKDRRIRQRHLLLGVLDCVRPDPAAELLAALGVDIAAARERVTMRPGTA